MIHLVMPDVQGGVDDFARILQAEIGPDIVHLVPLSVGNAGEWQIRAGDSVVLQMSGYGFSKRGTALWLLREMERRRNEIKSFGVFFHELYAFGPPWKSAFWVSPVQRNVVRRLAEISDFWMTNREGSAQWLRQYAGHKPYAVLPIPSTIGELKSLPDARRGRVVVFGSAWLRTHTYRAAGRALFQWAHQQSIEIHDIGSPVTDRQVVDALTSNGVCKHGRLEGDNISDLMQDALFGIIAYPVDYIAKSSVFAAYCAHGICPIVLSKKYMPSDGLLSGQHYLPGVPAGIVGDNKVQQLGKGAWGWYQSHTVVSHGNALQYFLDLR